MPQQAHAFTARKVIDPAIIHARFGHCRQQRLHQMPSRTTGFPSHDSLDHDPTTCPACLAGGARKKPTPKRTKQKFTYFGQRLSSDLCSFPTGIGDYKYAFCIVDAATNWLFVWLMKSKSSHEVKEAMETFLSTHQNSLSHGLSVTWHTDNGGEFPSTDLGAL